MIREANPRDLVEIVMIAKEFAKEVELEKKFGLSWNEDDALKFLYGAMLYPHMGLFVDDHNGSFRGILVCDVFRWIFNNSLQVASELILFVRKKYRGTKTAKMLAETLEEWAKEKKANLIQAGSVITFKMKETSRFFEKMGYPHTINTHVKRLREV